MKTPTKPTRQTLVLASALMAVFLLVGCNDDAAGGNVAIGETCSSDANCVSGAFCVQNICVDADGFYDMRADTGDTGDTNNNDTGDAGDTGGGDTGDTGGGDAGDTGGGDTGGDDDAVFCAEVNVSFEEVQPTVVLLIDQSGSMTGDFGGTERWAAVYDAFMAPNGLVQPLQDRVRFGLALYTSTDGDAGGMCPQIIGVDPDFNNHTAIDTVYAPERPRDETPTGESITAVLPMFASNPTGGPQMILLATDGEPDTCAEPNPQNGQGVAVAAAQDAFAQGIQTVVLSVGDQISDAHLQDMANAGVGAPVGQPGGATFYKTNNSAQLVSALETIITGARTCKFTLEGAIIAIPERGTVLVNGGPVTYNDADGWVLHMDPSLCFGQPQCIELQGQSCQDVLDTMSPTVNARFPCDAIVIN